MVRQGPVRAVAAFGAVLFAAGCGDETPKPTILDAAAIYADHEGLLRSVRAAYPGPYEDFVRIPSRDPTKADPMDADFLKFLREEIPVEFIDFFPIGDSGKDELDVVLWRYQSGNHWNTVSLVYFSMAMTFAEGEENMRAFDRCDDEALNWLQSQNQPASAFCHINDHWLAYQKVE
ncbi:hypothetical protein ACFOOP_04810 [Marinicaulis aureus]|uniref:Lipoprotein n=1 Tax=Hyphococcus aureus TaxID=2666033 RepID=A0ABW1KW95_9PROT